VADSTLGFLAFFSAKCEPVHTRVNSDPWRPVEEGVGNSCDYLPVCSIRGGFNGRRPLVQWPTRPLRGWALEIPRGLGGPGRLNFGLQLQIPDWNLNWVYDLFKLETSTLSAPPDPWLDLRGLLLREGRGREQGRKGREEKGGGLLVMWQRKLSALNRPLAR